MSVTLDITDVDVMTGLRAFLLAILPAGVGVYRGQDNRAAEPSEVDYVMMTPLMRERLGTNVTTYVDNTTLAILNENGQPIANETDGGFLYPEGSAVPPVLFGTRGSLQPTKVTIQLDIHGPGGTDNAQIVATLLRDDYACEAFTASTAGVQPLYAGDPRQAPFVNGEGQYEDRWTIDAVFQINATVTVQQDFTRSIVVNRAIADLTSTILETESGSAIQSESGSDLRTEGFVPLS